MKAELEDNELDDNEPLRNWQRSAIQLKPRKPFKRYTPPVTQRKARKKAVIESDDDVDDDEYTTPGRQKIPPRRGGKTGATKRAKK